MWSPPFVRDREMASIVDEIAQRYHVDPWTVIHWSPERLTLARTCMLAGKERRNRILSTPNADGSKPSVWVMMDVDRM